MHLNNPWDELYKSWPARSDREALALKLLSEAKIERIMDETGMNIKEFNDFMKWARKYEISHLCVSQLGEGHV